MLPRIIIVEDQGCIRELLREVLRSLSIVVIAETGDGEKACELILAHRPELVILDLILDDMHGFEVASRVHAAGFSGRILVFTGQLQSYAIQRIYDNNFAGAVSKGASLDILREAIRQVLAGKTYRCPQIARWRAAQLTNPKSPAKLLTARETEILELIGLAKSNTEIAELLGIAPTTVQGVRQSLTRKLDLPDTPNLVKFSQEQGYARFGASAKAC